MNEIGIFPFGEQVHDVVQQDRSPKKVFVLGVYASIKSVQKISERYLDISQTKHQSLPFTKEILGKLEESVERARNNIDLTLEVIDRELPN